jgi:hypothetical protein
VAHRNPKLELGLLSQSPESRAPASYGLTPCESIHLLCVDLRELSEAQRTAIQVSTVDQLDWLERASEQSGSLVVLLTKSAFMFYTTVYDKRVTLRPILATLAKRVRERPDLGKIRTIEQTGITAAHQLLTFAVECGSVADGIAGTRSEIHEAIALSTASSALGPTLASLFRAASNVVRRVRQETVLNDPTAGVTLIEVESLAAERIVEEELATWQSREVEVEPTTEQVSLVAPRRLGPFDSREPASEIRLRVTQPINPRISFLPDRKQSAS